MSDEIFPKPFEFPKNMSDMSWEQREQVASRYAKHVSTSGSIDWETSDSEPSAVLDPLSPEYAAMMNEKAAERKAKEKRKSAPRANSGGYKFDPKLGYIVPGEDRAFLESKEIPEETISQLLSKSEIRVPTEAAVAAARLAAMGPVEKASQRFANI
jgi:hypothetical protein